MNTVRDTTSQYMASYHHQQEQEEEEQQQQQQEKKDDDADGDKAGLSLTSLINNAAARRKLRQGEACVPSESSINNPAKKRRTLSKKEVIVNEWAVYKAEVVSEEEVKAVGGPLVWSAKAARVYPHISVLARKYLAVQASSAASERVFSVGGLMVTKKRNRPGGVLQASTQGGRAYSLCC